MDNFDSIKDEIAPKILIIGNVNVGKTSILARMADKYYSESRVATIGIDVKRKRMKVRGKNIMLRLWDTAGAEKYRSLTQNFYQGAHGAIVVFDVTDKQSFIDVESWLSDLRRQFADEIPILLVGNKIDKMEDRTVTTKDIEDFAYNNNNMKYVEASAKKDINIEKVFDTIATDILDQMDANPTEKSHMAYSRDPKATNDFLTNTGFKSGNGTKGSILHNKKDDDAVSGKCC